MSTPHIVQLHLHRYIALLNRMATLHLYIASFTVHVYLAWLRCMRTHVGMHTFEHASMMSTAKAFDWQQLSLLHDATEPAIQMPITSALQHVSEDVHCGPSQSGQAQAIHVWTAPCCAVQDPHRCSASRHDSPHAHSPGRQPAEHMHQ